MSGRGSIGTIAAMAIAERMAVVALVLGVASGALAANQPLTEWVGGSANHFGGPAEGDPFNPLVPIGGCSYGELNPMEFPHYNILSVAPDSELVSGKSMGGCGSCFELQCADSVEKCNNGPFSNSVVAMVGGTCLAGCGGTHVNLHVFAFDQLAPIRLGNIQIRMRQVTCTPKAKISVKVKTYRVGEGGYIKFVIRNVPGDGGLTAVELKGTQETGSWRPAENHFGAAWEASLLPDAPLDMRLTNTLGEQLVLKGVVPSAGFIGDIETGQQFRKAGRWAQAAQAEPPPSSAASSPWTNESSIYVGPSPAPTSYPPDDFAPQPAPPPYNGVTASLLDKLRGLFLGTPAPPGQDDGSTTSTTTVLTFPILSGR
ncbi:unnamed protein product [Ostreobium quekettii]|uniref:Expansin-like EG45 domain-containing protein n=1 Tax=Ostreobium quekettii TaxID=121088 RepID=A0A8S1IZQ4_9CHLO|nr:unnamed protein product [Ostreobium quekettii]|eukprot:evm.model.scf_1759.5 EVM.evm.TU.scf_1759.5   scf_1759:26456-30838(+)